MKTIQQCHNLQDVRNEIDRIDQALLTLLAERMRYVRRAVDFKTDATQIIDRSRIEAIIHSLRKLAEQHALEPDMVESLWRAMIDDFILLEKRLMAER